MQVRFLVDYRGKLTREDFYRAGDVVAFEDAIAQALVAEGRAEFVQVEQPEAAPIMSKSVRRRRDVQERSGGVL